MATTTFVDYETAVTAEWLNEVDNLVHTVFGNPTTAADARSAIDAVGPSDTQTLTNKTIVVASNTITTAAAGNLVATELNAALAELDGQDTTIQTNLDNHIADTTDAHDASAISNIPAGSIAATDLQAAINELDTEKQPIDATLTALAGTLTAANKIPYATALDTAGELDFKDEDDMASDSATAVPSQQSTKAYVDSKSNLLTEYEVTGSAVTSIDFQGLDINTHKNYRIVFDLHNPTGSTANVSLFCNNDTTATNYYTQLINVSGGTPTYTRNNSVDIVAMLASGRGVFTIDVSLVSDGTNAYMAANSKGAYASASTIALTVRTTSHTVSQTNITRLTFTSSVASSIGIGSKISIYRGDV